jgi:hypothetical protein
MALRHTQTDKLALSMFARDGIAAIRQLHMAATDAHQTGHTRAAAHAILEIAEAAEQALLGARGRSAPLTIS